MARYVVNQNAVAAKTAAKSQICDRCNVRRCVYRGTYATRRYVVYVCAYCVYALDRSSVVQYDASYVDDVD